MAIIQCPHCGKPVSDSIERCIHCGESLKADVPKTRDYDSLPPEQQVALKQEFFKTFPKFARAERAETRNSLLLLLSIFLGLGSIILVLVTRGIRAFVGELPLDAVLIIVAVFILGFLTSIICCIVFGVLLSSARKKVVVSTKTMQAWLKKRKGIVYNVRFDSKEQKLEAYYNSITINDNEI